MLTGSNLLITNGLIIDGSGASPYIGDILISGGAIARIFPYEEDLSYMVHPPCAQVDASGKVVCPGFIDVHSHADIPIAGRANSIAKLSQGITTHLGGQCGMSIFPNVPERQRELVGTLGFGGEEVYELARRSASAGEFLSLASQTAMPENVGYFVGHTALRMAAVGTAKRAATAQELETMKTLLSKSLDAGVFGMSAGLMYPPGSYADTEELIALAKVLADYGRIYAVHMRNESDGVIASIEETIRIGAESGAHVHISHLKACGGAKGMAQELLALIHKAQADGVEISADMYPYDASSTHLYSMIPDEYFAEGLSSLIKKLTSPALRDEIKAIMLTPSSAWENMYCSSGGFAGVRVATCLHTKEMMGKTIEEIAEAAGRDSFDTFFDLLVDNEGVVSAFFSEMSAADVEQIISDEDIMIGTDGLSIESEDSFVHPRAYASFAKAISYYVNERHLMPLEKMIRKMSGLSAQTFGLESKGYIKEGYDADITIFDPKTIKDCSDYTHSGVLCEGIDAVIVGGDIVYQDKKLGEARPGSIVLAG